jgi:hypothetical protein
MELSLEQKRALLGRVLSRFASGAGAPADYPLTPVQERLWFFDQLEPDTWYYNVPARLALDGPLSVGALERSLDEVVRRHDTLRTTIGLRGDQPRQVVAVQAPFSMAFIDLSAAPLERQSALDRFASEETLRPFRLAQGPLFRATLVRLEAERHVLFVTAHHVVCDGLSVRILLGELSTLYAAYAAGESSPLPPLPVQYGVFAQRERLRLEGGAHGEDIAYWRETLAGAKPWIEVPADRPRPPTQAYRGARVYGTISGPTAARLREIGQAQGATPFMVLLALWAVLLFRYSQQEDLVLGSPVGGRHDPDTEAMIGCFVNMLPLRCDLSGDPSFLVLLGRVRDVALGAYRHQALPFDRLVEELRPVRDPRRAPVFQVVLNMGSYADAWTVPSPGLTVTLESPAHEPSMVDLTLYATDTLEGIQLRAVFKADLFDAVTIEQMLRRLERLADAAAADPSQSVSSLPMIETSERTLLASAFTADLEEE